MCGNTNAGFSVYPHLKVLEVFGSDQFKKKEEEDTNGREELMAGRELG